MDWKKNNILLSCRLSHSKVEKYNQTSETFVMILIFRYYVRHAHYLLKESMGKFLAYYIFFIISLLLRRIQIQHTLKIIILMHIETRKFVAKITCQFCFLWKARRYTYPLMLSNCASKIYVKIPPLDLWSYLPGMRSWKLFLYIYAYIHVSGDTMWW